MPRERDAHGAAASEHVVQLFDTTNSLANVVSAFLNEGWLQGDHLLVVAKPAHWAKTSDRLGRRGCPVAQAIKDGRLSVLDAATTLARVMRFGVLDRQLFLDHVGALVGRLVSESSRGVRIYGEMVDLLAEEGDLRGVQVLERFWNDLRERQPFTLLCGYNAAHFTDALAMPALHTICNAHTRVQRNASDLLGNWLIGRDAPAS
ncbi:MAG TPA: MEDS domain-containing protein [Vicinamibacterales bacterium]